MGIDIGNCVGCGMLEFGCVVWGVGFCFVFRCFGVFGGVWDRWWEDERWDLDFIVFVIFYWWLGFIVYVLMWLDIYDLSDVYL